MNEPSEDTGSRRSRTPAGISEVLSAYFAPPERQQKLRAYRLWKFWDEVVGAQISAHARPLRIRDATLEVRVDQPVWMQQLQLLKPQLLKRLNERLGEELISDLFFRRGRLEPTVDSAPAKKIELAPLTDSEREQVAAAVASLPAGEVRDELGKLLQLQLRLTKTRKQSE